MTIFSTAQPGTTLTTLLVVTGSLEHLRCPRPRRRIPSSSPVAQLSPSLVPGASSPSFALRPWICPPSALFCLSTRRVEKGYGEQDR
ncbi:hypothetical protein A4X06_0g9183 [Tilletia controversa]|uniref:Uncharacterized protein n=1 Tax=Tilletia controversa TaxID=13291 RepID=A0A8X7SSH5_9BASI|nr:hypothetical protein CF328_g8660 [Tilletia controversa]KAE8237584.1 hypothetical protein A4X06_0g9183 [Tilletia controversa]